MFDVASSPPRAAPREPARTVRIAADNEGSPTPVDVRFNADPVMLSEMLERARLAR